MSACDGSLPCLFGRSRAHPGIRHFRHQKSTCWPLLLNWIPYGYHLQPFSTSGSGTSRIIHGVSGFVAAIHPSQQIADWAASSLYQA